MRSSTFQYLKIKLNGFTVAELLVVSVLSLVCAAAAFSAIKVFHVNFKSYENDSSEILKINNIQLQLNRDFIQSKEIVIREKEITFRQDSMNIHYLFKANYIIRYSNKLIQRPDTLLLGDFSTNAYWNNRLTEYGPIDQLDLSVKQENQDQEILLYFSKTYSAQTLIHGIKN